MLFDWHNIIDYCKYSDEPNQDFLIHKIRITLIIYTYGNITTHYLVWKYTELLFTVNWLLCSKHVLFTPLVVLMTTLTNFEFF